MVLLVSDIIAEVYVLIVRLTSSVERQCPMVTTEIVDVHEHRSPHPHEYHLSHCPSDQSLRKFGPWKLQQLVMSEVSHVHPHTYRIETIFVCGFEGYSGVQRIHQSDSIKF